MKNLKKLFFLFLLFPLVSFAQYPWSNALGSGGYSPAAFVSWLYNYALYIVGAAAVIMIVWGGIVRLTSAGNPGKQGESNTIIFNAILGVLLLFGSYLILKELNPELLNLKDPQMQTLNANSLDLESGGDSSFISLYNNCVKCLTSGGVVSQTQRFCYSGDEVLKNIKDMKFSADGSCTTAKSISTPSLDKLSCGAFQAIKKIKDSQKEWYDLFGLNSYSMVISKGSNLSETVNNYAVFSQIDFVYNGCYTNSQAQAQSAYFLAKKLTDLSAEGLVYIDGSFAANKDNSCKVSLQDVINAKGVKDIGSCKNLNHFTAKFPVWVDDCKDLPNDKNFCGAGSSPVVAPIGGSYSASCYPLYKVKTGDSWPPKNAPKKGLLTDSQALAIFRKLNVQDNVSSRGFACSSVGQSGCTSLWGTPAFIEQRLKELINACNSTTPSDITENKKCNGKGIMITGLAEFWGHVSHGPGRAFVDMVYYSYTNTGSGIKQEVDFNVLYPALLKLQQQGAIRSFICENGSQVLVCDQVVKNNAMDHFHINFNNPSGDSIPATCQ